MDGHSGSRRRGAVALALAAVLGLTAACGDDVDDVTNDPVDDSSTTPPEEGDNGDDAPGGY